MSSTSRSVRKVVLPVLPNFLPCPNWFNSRAVATTKSGKVAMACSHSLCIFDAEEHRYESIWYLSHYAMNVRCSKSSEKIMIAGDTAFTIVDGDRVLTEHRFGGLETNFKITAADWSEEQNCIVFGSALGSIFVQKLNSLDQQPAEFSLIRPNPGDDSYVTCVEICPHPEHKKLVAVGFKNGQVCLFSWDDGRRTFRSEHSQAVDCLVWSPSLSVDIFASNRDGSYLSNTVLLASSGNEGCVIFWRVNLTDENDPSVFTHRLSPPRYQPRANEPKRFFPLLWPKQTPNKIIVITASYNNELITIQLSRDLRGLRHVNTTPWQYKVTDGQREGRRPLTRHAIFGICFAGKPRRQVITNSYDGLVKTWEWSSAKEIRSFRTSLQTLNAACVSGNANPGRGSILVSLHSKMFHLSHGKIQKNSSKSIGDEAAILFGFKIPKVTAIAFCPNGQNSFAVGFLDGQVAIMEQNMTTTRDLSFFGVKPANTLGSVTFLQFGPGLQDIATWSGDPVKQPDELLYVQIGKKVLVYSPAKMKDAPRALKTLLFSRDPAFSRDADVYSFHWFQPLDFSGVLAVGYDNGCIRIFKPVGGQIIHIRTLQASVIGEIVQLAWHPSRPVLAAVPRHEKNAVEVFSLVKQELKTAKGADLADVVKPTAEFDLQKDRISCISWLPPSNGRDLLLAVGSAQACTIQIYDVLGRSPVCNYRGHGATVRYIAPSPTNREEVISASEDGCTFCWRWSEQPDLVPPYRHTEEAGEQEEPDWFSVTRDLGRLSTPDQSYLDDAFISNRNPTDQACASGQSLAANNCTAENSMLLEATNGLQTEMVVVRLEDTHRRLQDVVSQLRVKFDRLSQQDEGLKQLVSELQQQNESQMSELARLKECSICCSDYSTARYRVVLLPCGHASCCSECIAQIEATERARAIDAAMGVADLIGLRHLNMAYVSVHPKCPNCRSVFTSKQRIFDY